MKSAIIAALTIVPALTGILDAAEPLGPPLAATALREVQPPESAAEKPAGAPIGLVIRIYEMDTKKLGPSLDFRPMKDDRTTVNAQFEAFRKAGFVQVLAEPHLVTQDGRPATCLSGGEFPLLVPAGRETVAIDWLEFGTRIEVTPRRVKQDRIQVRIAAEFARRAEHGLTSEDQTTPIVVGRLIRTAATLGPKDIVVLNDHEARESDEPGKVVFMTIELVDVGVEAALLQFDAQDGKGDLPAPPRRVPNRSGSSLEPTGGQPVDLPGEVETGEYPEEGSAGSPLNAGPTRKTSAASSNGSFFLKPGKTQLELTRGTWRSLTIPSKDFAYGSSLLVESPEDGAISISGRLLEPQLDVPAKTETIEAGDADKKYFADIWTIHGVKAGIATIRLIDDNDQEYEIEVTVKGDTRHFDTMVKRFHPNARVEAHELTSGSVILTGEASAEDIVAIREIAEELYPTVLLRLKTQPTLETLLDGPDPGESVSTSPDPGSGVESKTENSVFAPTVTVGDSYADPVQHAPKNNSNDYGSGKGKNDYGSGATRNDYGSGAAKNDYGSGAGKNDYGSGKTKNSTTPEGYGETQDQSISAGTTDFTPFPPEGQGPAATIAGFRTSGKPPAPTTQVRFLHGGFISMQTEVESGGFARVEAWDSWQVYKNVGGNFQQIRYSAHRENIPQGSQTRLQFRTTEFRDDVWVNGVLVTATANEKTRYFLKHFPVDLVLEDHEVVAAAQGKLVSRFVVMKDPGRVPVLTEQGETVEPRESFTGPNSFNQAVAEGRKQGQLLAVLILGPEAMLQREFSLTQSTELSDENDYGEGVNPYSDLQNPYGTKSSTDPLGGPMSEFENDKMIQKPLQAGSVSTEMRQLRQEVRSLREQLGKLVEVLSREHQPRTETITPDGDPFGSEIESGPPKRPVPIPPPTIEDNSHSKQPRPVKPANPFEPPLNDEVRTDEAATPASSPRPVPDPGTGSEPADSGGPGADRPAEAIPPAEISPARDSTGR